MGEIYLELTIANIEDRRRQKELPFLVDTGATRAWVSQQVAKELGIKKLVRSHWNWQMAMSKNSCMAHAGLRSTAKRLRET